MNWCALTDGPMGCTVESLARRSDGKSRFWIRGIMGPGKGVMLKVWHTSLKFSSVGPISRWLELVLGIDQGKVI